MTLDIKLQIFGILLTVFAFCFSISRICHINGCAYLRVYRTLNQVIACHFGVIISIVIDLSCL